MRPLFAIAALMFGLLSSTTAIGEETIRLDDRRIAALAALPLLRGPAPSPASLDGQVVVVAFFASWCPPCHPEFDHLKEAELAYGDKVTVLTVNIFELTSGFTDTTRLARFLDRKDPPFAVLGDGETVASLFGEVERIPTLFVFNAQGDPVLQFIHARGATKTHVGGAELRAAIEQAIAGS